jgi:glycosyltransferase involved in cell wall biosynthesis
LVEREQPDFVLMNSMFSKPFTVWPLQLWARSPKGMRLLLAPRGMLAAGALSVKSTKKKLFLSLFRWKRWHKAVTFVATGEHEAEDIRRIFGKEMQVRLAPNLPEPELPAWEVLPKGEATLFLSVARISPEKNNLWMLERFSQLQVPAKLILIGPVGDAEYGARCRQVIGKMPSHLQVEELGPQPPEQVAARMRQSHFLLLPTLGENFGHAIVEALTAGKPVIISDKTPWRGLAADKAGWDLPLEEKGFAQTLDLAARMSQEEYQLWCQGARKRAETFLLNPELAERNKGVFTP